MPALWQCLTWLPYAVCSLSLVLLYKALSVGSGGGSQRLLSPYPCRTKVVLLCALHCFFLQWSQTVVKLMLRVAEEPSSLSWVPISQPQIATGEVPAWGFWPSCHDPPCSFLTLLSFPWPRCGGLADLLQIPVDAHHCPKKLATQEKT